MQPSRFATWVLLTIATGVVVLAIALPSPGGRARQPLAADVWPGFEPRPVALAELGGLMLKLAVERRDEPLEMRIEDADGRGFDWPVGDLYAGLDQHWVGLLEPGDWRISIRRPGTAGSLAQRRFSLAAGKSHGLALDLRRGLGDPDTTHTLAVDIGFAARAPEVTARVVALDELFEARRAGRAEPEGVELELARSADGRRLAGHAECSVGEHLLILEPLGFEHVFHVAGAADPALFLDLSEIALAPAFVDAAGAPAPEGTRYAWSVSLAPGAPAIFWRAPHADVGADAPSMTSVRGEFRAALALPGRRSVVGVRAMTPLDGGAFTIATAPRRRGE